MFAIAAVVFVLLWLLNGSVFELPAMFNQLLLVAALVCAVIFAMQQARKRRRGGPPA